MLSKRRFLIMAVMMFVLLFMFQFSQVMKERGNEYDENEYIMTSKLSSDNTWKMLTENDFEADTRYVVFIGDREDAIGRNIEWWCNYTKRSIVSCESLKECSEERIEKAQLVLLESAFVDFENDTDMLLQLVEGGTSLMFCDLPEVSVIQENDKLRKLLKIDKVMAEQVQLEGVNLFSGFLLGGQAIYKADTEKEKKERQDLDLLVPWYLTGNGCKTYMVGMLADKKVKNEQLPALIWRAGVGDGKVFAINGDYMSDCTGIGILDAVMTELHSYEIYPVVNAQNLAVANFPGFASENKAKMNELYSRDQIAIFRDILWPGLCSMIERNNLNVTCYLSPQFDYTDTNEPQSDQLVFYLKEMKEKGAEAGLTTDYVSAVSLPDKLTRDDDFLASADSSYEYSAAYVPEHQLREVPNLKDYNRYANLRTVISNSLNSEPIVSYQTDTVTLQSITGIGISHTYSEDLRMKSLQTALGYSNIVWDLKQIAWPKEKDERWEILFEKFASNIDTYWKKFNYFTNTTASESDRRVRAFLAADFSEKRSQDTIHLEVQNIEGKVWFILRTHGEEIEKMTGGSFEKLEEDAYLIYAGKNKVEIQLKKTDSLYYHLP